MKMFHWENCNYNEQFSGGDIIILADNVEEARRKAKREAFKDIGDYNSHNPARMASIKQTFMNDIAKEPKTPNTIFISGSA